ncbi:MAG: hypothetical protein ABIL01_28720 [Pseudomonadota bacterium]
MITILGFALTVAIFAVCFVAAYQQQKFGEEWTEDHANDVGFTRWMRLSTTALFSKSLSERCYRRRRQVALWWAAFFVLIGMQLLTIYILRSL